MANRAPIERWSRGELEDRFHSVADSLSTLKQTNNRLEREVKILNGRLSGRHSQRTVPNGPQKDELDELHRTNHLMAQKLKVLKHQLLNYTKVNSSTSLTGRYRPATASQRQQQQQKSRLGQRPQSAVISLNGNQTKGGTAIGGQAKHAQMGPSELGQINGRKRPISQPAIEEKYEFDESEHQFEATHSEADRMEQNKELGEERMGKEINEKLREMQRHNRKVTDDNEELRFSLGKSEEHLSTLRSEYDRVVRELSQAQRELRSQSDSLSSEREDAQRRVDGSARSAEIADRELAIAREECKTLRKAHERLVEKSLQQEHSGKTILEELVRLRAKVQQSASENETERREWEEEKQRMRRENAKLREARERETDERMQQKEREKENGHLTDEKRKRENQPMIGDEPTEKNTADDQIGQTQRRRDGDKLLSKLFTDVIGIVESHWDSRGKMDDSAPLPIGDGNSRERWQKLYEDMYFELGKVRKLLLSEHEMNVRLKEEKRQLLAQLDFAKIKFEKQLAELKEKLGESGKRIAVLENELQFVAKSGQIRHNVLSSTEGNQNGDPSAEEQREKASAIEPTEMTLQIARVVLTEEAVRQAQHPCPMLFLAIEFFDFEIQTTKVTNGPEAIFDFTAVFDTPISDLFIHYIQTEGMEIELYSVKEGLSYELWSKAKIPLKKLLSTQTPTQFHGELKFRALSRGLPAENQQKEQPMLLATAFYSIQVPFSFLRSLNAQRRRMIAAAMIPIGKDDLTADEPFNELVVHIHRCTGIDRLRGDPYAAKKQRKSKPSTYVAYEFFNFPVHLSRTVRESANPAFDDRQSWRVPADSEAVHRYLKEKDLLFYLIDEGTEDSGVDKMSPKARVLASVHLPLFPLARNDKIRGTFALLDRADESITSESSIDVSIYWKFAYVFDGLEDLKMEEKVPLKTFTPLTEQNVPKEAEQSKSVRTDHSKKEPEVISPEENERKEAKEMPTKRQIIREQSALERIGIRDLSADISNGGSESEEAEEEADQWGEEGEGEELPEEELRRRLLLLPKPTKKSTEEGIRTESNGQSQRDEAARDEAEDQRRISESDSDSTQKSSRSSATIVVDHEKALERTTSDEISEDLLKEGSYSEGEPYAKDEEEEDDGDEDDRSIRSDATYTAEGPLGPIELDEPRMEGVEDEEEVMVIRDEDLQDRVGKLRAHNGGGDEEAPPETMAPVPASRRSLLGPIPPIPTEGKQPKKHPAPLPPPPTTQFLARGKAVDFAEPLHSSIPPSDVSSSFAEDITLGSGRSSNSSEANGSTASNGQQRQLGEEEQEKRRKKHRTKKRTKAPIELAPAPPTPAIRIRPAVPESGGEGAEGASAAALVPPNSAKVGIRIAKLRLLDHLPQPFDHGEGDRVFVEWNFLDFAREQCVTESDAEMPRMPTESVNFDHQSEYELDQNRIALLTQWTELNIRLTFTLVMDQGSNDDLDDVCMGELDLLDVFDTSTHSLLMRNVDNLSVAVLEVDIAYSDNLLEYMREAMRGIMEEANEGGDGGAADQFGLTMGR